MQERLELEPLSAVEIQPSFPKLSFPAIDVDCSDSINMTHPPCAHVRSKDRGRIKPVPPGTDMEQISCQFCSVPH